MALRLCELGWTVGVRDVDAAREAECVRAGAAAHATPAALAAALPVVVVAVVDAAQCDAVLFGADGWCRARAAAACVVLCPTLGPASTEAIAARLAEHGIACIDAPMSGGPARARDGSMSLMVACAEAVFERQRALLEALSTSCSGSASGPATAPAPSWSTTCSQRSTSPAPPRRSPWRAARPRPRAHPPVIEQSSGQNWIGSDRMRRAIAGDLAPRAHTTLLAKDTGSPWRWRCGGHRPPFGRVAPARSRRLRGRFRALDDASLLELLRERRQRRTRGAAC